MKLFTPEFQAICECFGFQLAKIGYLDLLYFNRLLSKTSFTHFILFIIHCFLTPPSDPGPTVSSTSYSQMAGQRLLADTQIYLVVIIFPSLWRNNS